MGGLSVGLKRLAGAFAGLCLLLALSCGFTVGAYAVDGHPDGEYYDGSFWYFYEGGAPAASKFCYVWDANGQDGKWCYYDWQGHMLYGQQYIDEGWYYLDPVTGAVDREWTWLPDDGKWVYYDAVSGRMLHGRCDIDGDSYYFDEWTGESDYSQVMRWNMRTASGAPGINFFNGASASAESVARLEEVSNALYSQGYSLGYLLMDIQTGKGVCCNVDYTFFGASTVKAPYVMSLMQSVFGYDWGAARGYQGSITNAIVWSVNEDYLSLRNRFGSEPLKSFCASAGVDASYTSLSYPFATPRTMAKLWCKMYSDFGKGTGGAMVRSLTQQSQYSPVKYALGGSYAISSKGGWVGSGGAYDATNDTAIVYSDKGPYLLAIMSTLPSNQARLSAVPAALNEVYNSMMSR